MFARGNLTIGPIGIKTHLTNNTTVSWPVFKTTLVFAVASQSSMHVSPWIQGVVVLRFGMVLHGTIHKLRHFHCSLPQSIQVNKNDAI